MTRRSFNHIETDRTESEELPQMPDITTNRLSVSGLMMGARQAGSLVLRCGTAAFVVVAASLLLVPAGAQASNGVCGSLTVSNPSGNVGASSDPCLITSDSDLDTMLSMINADTSHTARRHSPTSSPQISTTPRTAPTPRTPRPRTGVESTGSAAPSTATATRSATSSTRATARPRRSRAVTRAGSDLGFFRVLNDATVREPDTAERERGRHHVQ